MEKSTVYVSMNDKNDLSCSYAIVDKGEKSVIIIFKDLECVIFDYDYFKSDDFDFKYLLLKHYNDTSLAYKDFMKLIGKMCKKNIDSKYFKNHIIEDNRIIFYDAVYERSITKEETNDYLDRKNRLKEFIKVNKDKFIK